MRARREGRAVTPDLAGDGQRNGVPLLILALRVERDIFLIRQRGREVAAAVGLEYQDQVRVATALSEMGRELLTGNGADVTFALTEAPTQRLTVEMISLSPTSGEDPYGGRTPDVG